MGCSKITVAVESADGICHPRTLIPLSVTRVIDVPDIPGGIVPTSDLFGASKFPATYQEIAAATKVETTNVKSIAFRRRRRSSIKRGHPIKQAHLDEKVDHHSPTMRTWPKAKTKQTRSHRLDSVHAAPEHHIDRTIEHFRQLSPR